MINKINLSEKFDLIDKYWSPRIAGELNDSYVKLAKLQGDFVWHKHEDEDELFLVIQGKLVIKLRDQKIELKPNEFVIIPKGVEHKPVAAQEVHVLLLELKSTVNTGDVQNEFTTGDHWI